MLPLSPLTPGVLPKVSSPAPRLEPLHEAPAPRESFTASSLGTSLPVGLEEKVETAVSPVPAPPAVVASRPPVSPALLLQEPLSSQFEGHLQAVTRQLCRADAPANPYFIDDYAATGLPFKSIAQADAFTMSLSGARAEDALVACGAALAKGVPSLYVVPDRKQLPWFLQQADQTYPGLVSILEGDRTQVVAEKGAQALSGLRAQPLPGYPFPQTKVDTFIGCLMSGLTKEQYAEGRSHLQTINSALGQHLSSADNYCEGINVGSVGDFGTPRESLGNDLEAVRRARNCVFYAFDQQPRPSGMWVELGAALAWDKPCTVLVPDRGCLPPGLRGGPLPENLHIVEYGDHPALLRRLAGPQGAQQLLR